MRNVVCFCLILIGSSASAAYREFVDIGFRDADQHVAIRLASVDGQDALGFGLTSNASGKNVPLNECLYPRAALLREVERIRDPQVKADFDWIFARSGYASSPVTQFYPEFRDLLSRVRSECAVPELQRLRDRLDSQPG